jgi:hypothetical protein
MHLRKDKPVKESFYNKLDQLYQRIPTHDTKIIVGDCNAETGRLEVFKSVIGNWSQHETSYKNGIKATDCATNTGRKEGDCQIGLVIQVSTVSAILVLQSCKKHVN